MKIIKIKFNKFYFEKIYILQIIQMFITYMRYLILNIYIYFFKKLNFNKIYFIN